ncbi:Threonine synthase-like [Syntrophomonas zehnderi OL-4]|uniref:Threonine synthase n=1 Tax=Syntrophomonas zehnderi OL-4 TaxID=690567 RepID=A0A0E4C8L6_9FIRM|nr:Threonine synthase-like [Syntrophomonas zehnderi OL-4]
MVRYQSTRGKYSHITAAEAIKMGIAPDGGLFVPDVIPGLSPDDLKKMENLTYQERACLILGLYLEDFSAEEIKSCVSSAYNETSFDDERIVPLVKIADDLFIQELWHGPTCAFKDMALQILPHLLTCSAQKTGENKTILILVATSGDTGKAALEGFKDVPGTQIVVFYPADGVSEVQKQQMITQEGKNIFVAAVEGNFDDAQTGVKNIFANEQFIQILNQQGIKMSSANSINWGRLLPQIVYYVSSYVDLRSEERIREGQAINIVVPTGNFGNILAAYYASRMGVPINKLICASNTNNVLTEFIRTGSYDRKRKFERTISPSMDILISSNLERLLYELTDHDAAAVSRWMEELSLSGSYQVNDAVAEQLTDLFWADFANDQQTMAAIKEVWQQHNYLLDTHTAVAWCVYKNYRQETDDSTPTLIASTASPYKFAGSVAESLLDAQTLADKTEFEILSHLARYTGQPIPAAIQGLEKKPILHKTITTQAEMGNTVLTLLGNRRG